MLSGTVYGTSYLSVCHTVYCCSLCRAWPRSDGAVEPVGCGWRDHSIQLSCGRVRLEPVSQSGVWQLHSLVSLVVKDKMSGCPSWISPWCSCFALLSLYHSSTSYCYPVVFLPSFLSFRKGAPSTPLMSVAVSKVVQEVLACNSLSPAICTTVCGGAEIGRAISVDKRVPLVSFTGSTKVKSHHCTY